MAVKKLDRFRCARLSSSAMTEVAEGGSRAAPEFAADGAIDAGFGIEFMFPFGRLFSPSPTKKDFRSSGFRASLFRLADGQFCIPQSSFRVSLLRSSFFPIMREPCKLPPQTGAQVTRDDSSAAEGFGRLKIARQSAILVVAWRQMTGLRTKVGCRRKIWPLLLSVSAYVVGPFRQMSKAHEESAHKCRISAGADP
jgi:hypothetical protein